MDFAEWKDLSRRDPAAAAERIFRSLAALPEAQRSAIVSHALDRRTVVESLARGASHPSPLGGVPYALKDLFDLAGRRTLAGSRLREETALPASADAPLVSTMAKAGATVVFKTHLHEFAYGLTGENARFGDVEHPRFPGRTSGGSSSGSAAAVAAGIVPLAVGTDTGGSIRVPSAFCGVYGLRLSPGDRWIEGAFPLAPRFDTAGWFTRKAEDMRRLLGWLAPGSMAIPSAPFHGGWLGFDGGLETPPATGLAESYRQAAEAISEPMEPELRDLLETAFRGVAEAYSILQSIDAYGVHRDWLDRHRDRYEPAVWQRIDRGRRWSEEQIAQAEAKRAAVRAAWETVFRRRTFVVLPASPFAALSKAECTGGNRNRLLALTAPASLGGWPVLTLPYELPGGGGLTSGLQIVFPDLETAARTGSRLLASSL